MIRRIIDADNSCLFNAVGYTLRRKRKVGTELRQMITQAVRGDPLTYTEVRESFDFPPLRTSGGAGSFFVRVGDFVGHRSAFPHGEQRGRSVLF